MLTHKKPTTRLVSPSDKAERIIDAAYQLFIERGDADISIQEIAERAGIAKGTVYLYFHDKEELKNSLITQKSREFFQTAVNALRATDIVGLEEQMIFVINYIINLLTQNPMALRLIAKNLSFGLFNQKLQDYIGDDSSDVMRAMLLAAKQNGVQLRSPQVLLFMIIELTSSTCFSCILESRPLPIQDYKPYLFETIRNMIRAATIYPKTAWT